MKKQRLKEASKIFAFAYIAIKAFKSDPAGIIGIIGFPTFGSLMRSDKLFNPFSLNGLLLTGLYLIGLSVFGFVLCKTIEHFYKVVENKIKHSKWISGLGISRKYSKP